MDATRRLVLATHNKDKQKEFSELLTELGIEVLTLDSFPQIGEIVEDGETLNENALKKAREVFRQTGLPSLADDTGLEVFYLNGAPGVYSARYAGEGVSYAQNVAKLLQEMLGVPERRRQAQFRCVLSLVGWKSEPIFAEGTCPGTITEEPTGTNGFGYDPVFLPSGFDRTFAELTSVEKNSISHRGLAARALKKILQEERLKDY